MGPPVPPIAPPTGTPLALSETEAGLTLVKLRAFGEIMGMPTAQLNLIIAKARSEMLGP